MKVVGWKRLIDWREKRTEHEVVLNGGGLDGLIGERRGD